MLDSLFYSTTEETITFAALAAGVGAALVIGLLISLVYIATHKEEGYSGSFVITLIMLPAIVSVIILLIGSNVARAFSLAGAFSLIRYRSAPGDPKDIAYVFFAMAVGLACGMGFIPYAAAFAGIICVVMFLLHFTHFGKPKTSRMQLTVTLPENVNYQGLFDDVFAKYTTSWKMKKVRTTDFGTLFDVVYSLEWKEGSDQKAFIDELRCRNGNLNVILAIRENDERFSVAQM